jgi:hypothetical protein
MMRSILTCAALACFASFATPALRAQSEPATIPTVLGAALIGGFGEMAGKGPHFFVGQAPAGWPAALVTPTGASVVGGVAIGPMRMAVYRYPRSVDPIASYTAVLSRAGFKPYLTETNDAGFVSQRRREATMFCGDAGSLGIVQLDSTATTRTLVASIVTGGNSAPCATMSFTPTARSKEPLAIPSLFAPRGVAVRPGSRGWSDGSIELSAQLDTTMSTDAILAHYSAQFTAAGWKALGAPTRAEGMAAQQLATRDASGTEWRGAVFVITVGDGRDVLLRMARAPQE